MAKQEKHQEINPFYMFSFNKNQHTQTTKNSETKDKNSAETSSREKLISEVRRLKRL